MPRSCRDLLTRRPTASSGEYYLALALGQIVKAYCEFALGDPVTFFSPGTYYDLTQEDIDYVHTNKTFVLFRALKVDGSQPFGAASQLPAYQQYPVMALIDSYNDFKIPHSYNINTFIGEPYIYIGFIPMAVAANKTTQGLRLNGQALEFNNCDANPNSYLAFYANVSVTDPPSTADSFTKNHRWGERMMSNFSLILNISSMPASFFSFMEMGMGGCGCYGTTADGDATLKAMSVGLC